MLPQNFFRLDYFNINKVDIQESAKMLQPELTKLSEKLYNKNIIYIDSNEIKEFLEKDVRVEDVTITKKSLGEISIDVKEKDLSYYAVIGKNIYLVDKAGEIFAYLNETDGVKIKTNRIEENDEVNKEKQNKRYLIAQQLYFNMSKERKIDYIDLRFNDYIIKYLGDNK